MLRVVAVWFVAVLAAWLYGRLRAMPSIKSWLRWANLALLYALVVWSLGSVQVAYEPAGLMTFLLPILLLGLVGMVAFYSSESLRSRGKKPGPKDLS